jgi:signal peptidase II
VRIGEVIDFIDVHLGAYHWPAFNVADSAITVGAFIMLFALFKRPKEHDHSP